MVKWLFPLCTFVCVLSPSTSEAQTWKVCEGEYEIQRGRRVGCRGDYDAYVYCGETDNWARQACIQSGASGEFTKVRLRTYGGNKCGYSIDQVSCK